jgi:hypothetical protein
MIQNKFLTRNTERLTQLAQFFPHYVYKEVVDRLDGIEKESWERLEEHNTMLDFVFARSMKKFYEDNETYEHIYTKKFDIPQIKLFELLIRQFPAIGMTQELANSLICHYLRGWEDAVLMDIGIGTGHQTVDIIRKLAQQPNLPTKTLTIVGIEPFSDAVEATRHNLEEIAKEVPFTVRYVLKNAFAENMTDADWLQLTEGLSRNLIVNGSFALHHIKSRQERGKVFEHLRNIPAKAIVLSEPNVDHYESNYYQRFKNCLHLFSLLFEAIDELPLTPEEKNALKLFFSREIDDILGCRESERVEKHASTWHWLALLQEAGYVPTKKGISFHLPERYRVDVNNDNYDFWSICYKQENIISVILAEPIEEVLLLI